MSGIVLIGTIRFPAASMDRIAAPMRAVVEATRGEDGCVFYSLAPDPTDAGLVTVAEVWRDMDALNAHSQTAHMAVWRDACAELGLHDRQLTVYDAANARSR